MGEHYFKYIQVFAIQFLLYCFPRHEESFCEGNSDVLHTKVGTCKKSLSIRACCISQGQKTIPYSKNGKSNGANKHIKKEYPLGLTTLLLVKMSQSLSKRVSSGTCSAQKMATGLLAKLCVKGKSQE